MRLSHEISRLRIAFAFGAVVLVVTSALGEGLSAQKKSAPPTSRKEGTVLVGRVLADIASLINDGSLNWKYESFIFGAELKGEGGKLVVLPVEICYAYEPPSDSVLPDSFFDHSKFYELHVTRNSDYDRTVNDIAYEKSVNAETQPIKVLRLLLGAPGDLLKPDLVLPYYVLYSDGYKVLTQDKGVPHAPKSPSPNSKGGNSQP